MNKNLVMLLCIIALWLLVIKPLNKQGTNSNNGGGGATVPKVEEAVDDPSTYPDYDYDSSLAVMSQTSKENAADLLAAGRGYTV